MPISHKTSRDPPLPWTPHSAGWGWGHTRVVRISGGPALTAWKHSFLSCDCLLLQVVNPKKKMKKKKYVNSGTVSGTRRPPPPLPPTPRPPPSPAARHRHPEVQARSGVRRCACLRGGLVQSVGTRRGALRVGRDGADGASPCGEIGDVDVDGVGHTCDTE